MTQENGKKRLLRGFNVLDIAIVLIVVAIIAGLVLKSGFVEKVTVAASDTPVEFTVVVENVRSMSASAVSEGDSFIDLETGVKLGTVTQVSTRPYYDKVETLDGRILSSRSPDRISIVISAKGQGRDTDLGFYLNGNRHVAPGSEIRLGTDTLECTGYVYQIRIQ